MNMPDFLSIDGCIEFICVGRNFSEQNLQIIIEIIVQSMGAHRQILTPHDFAKQFNSDGRIFANDIASIFISNLNKALTSYNVYKEHLVELEYDI